MSVLTTTQDCSEAQRTHFVQIHKETEKLCTIMKEITQALLFQPES